MIRLPWAESTAPNVMLDITDACNLSCRFCYKSPAKGFKSFEQIRSDLEAALALRRLHTVTISGGEPTLHPDLTGVIRLIKSRGLHAFLLTNGVRVDAPLVDEFVEAGLDSILFHVDTTQKRPDIPNPLGFNDLIPRINRLIGLAAARGLDVSLSYTLERPDDMHRVTDYFLRQPDASFLFLSRGVDPDVRQPDVRAGESGISVKGVTRLFREQYNLEPYAYIQTLAGKEPVWISFFLPYVMKSGRMHGFQIRSNRSDIALMKLHRCLMGRYMHKTVQQPSVTLFRVLVNSLSRFRFLEFARFLRHIFSSDQALRHKMIVFDEGPRFDASGEPDRCEYCPTAIVRDGRLVPCCTVKQTSAGAREVA